MAQLLPADFDLSRLEHSERRVCEAFLKGLDETWTLVPSIPLVDKGDAEIDLLLVSPTQGAIAIEVKGGSVHLENGDWYQYDHRMKRSPFQQVTNAKHTLLRRLTSANVDMSGIFIQHAVALPDVGEIPAAGLGPDAPANLLFAKPELEDPARAVARLERGDRQPIAPERMKKFLQAVRPTVELPTSNAGVLRATSRRLDEATQSHLAAVRSLDAQQRVLVLGGAGSGKTWLAMDWAKRAVARGERTAVVCFNKPIAEMLQRGLADTTAMVGTYHDIAVRLLEPHGWRVGAGPTPEYWENVPTSSLGFHAAAVGQPFDTIVIDEGQDIRPHWLESLERLLDPAGPQRLLMVADPAQAIYVKPWTAPANVVTMDLPLNLRNARPIAALVRRLGGPELMPNAPGSIAVAFVEAGGRKEIRKRVRDTVQMLGGEHGVPFGEILVVTTRSQVRDGLMEEPIEGCPLTRWEDRTEDAVLCETVHRAKGLERAAVIYVDPSSAPDPTLLYIGASRAVGWLTLVGSPELSALLRP